MAVPLALSVSGIVKRYGNTTAVDGVTFDVAQGEVFGLLGPNGAGKTTTLEIVEGLRRADAGEVRVVGIDARREPRKVRSRIGVQLQEAGFFHKMTVLETLQMFAAFYPQAVAPETLLERLNLMQKRDSLVEGLSGGQKQRLSIALALLNDPKLVFLDEPTTGLDPQARRNTWDVVEEIRREGRTVVLTTHYMDEAQILCDRIAIMDQGRVIATGTPAELIRDHAPGGKITMEFTANARPSEDDLAALPDVSRIEHTDTGLTLWCVRTETTLFALLERLKAAGVSYRGLTVETPTLEDVFLNLTGQQLRD